MGDDPHSDTAEEAILTAGIQEELFTPKVSGPLKVCGGLLKDSDWDWTLGPCEINTGNSLLVTDWALDCKPRTSLSSFKVRLFTEGKLIPELTNEQDH